MVSGDIDALERVAAALRELDDALSRHVGEVTDTVLAFHRSSPQSLRCDSGEVMATMARRWRASTESIASQGIDFAKVDRAEGPAGVTRRKPLLSDENNALAVLLARFREFDTAAHGDAARADNRVSRSDLLAAARRNDEVGASARWILAQPDLVEFLDTGSENTDYLDKLEEGRFYSRGGDGRFSAEDVVGYIEKREVNRILRDVSSEIDVAAEGGVADGVMSRADYLAFLGTGEATDEQVLAISVALRDGAVDGEQGVASDVADAAASVATVSGYASAGLALASMAMASTGVLAPAAAVTGGASGLLGTVSLAAGAVEGAAGLIAGEDEHVIAAGIGLAAFGAGRAASVTIRGVTTPAGSVLRGSADEILAGMLEGTAVSRVVADVTEAAIATAGAVAADAVVDQRSSVGPDADSTHRSREASRGTGSKRTRKPDG